MRKLICTGVVVMAVVLTVSVGFRAGASTQETSLDDQERVQALNTVRLLNTAQVTYKYGEGKGRYGSFAELVGSGQFRKNIEAISLRGPKGRAGVDTTRFNLQSEDDFLSGWKLSLVVAPDGQSYKLSLIHPADKCRFGFFTDQVGIIYNGKAIDCPVY